MCLIWRDKFRPEGCLLGTGDAEEVEGLLVDGCRPCGDGEGSVRRNGGDDSIPGDRREVGEQGLEAVDGEAVVGPAGGLLGDGGGRSLGLGDDAGAEGVCGLLARYKGEAEKALLAAGFPRVYIFRPAYIYPVEPRKEPNFSYRLLRAIYPAFRALFPNQVIRADDLARTMVDIAVRETGKPGGLILENRDIRAMVE